MESFVKQAPDLIYYVRFVQYIQVLSKRSSKGRIENTACREWILLPSKQLFCISQQLCKTKVECKYPRFEYPVRLDFLLYGWRTMIWRRNLFGTFGNCLHSDVIEFMKKEWLFALKNLKKLKKLKCAANFHVTVSMSGFLLFLQTAVHIVHRMILRFNENLFKVYKKRQKSLKWRKLFFVLLYNVNENWTRHFLSLNKNLMLFLKHYEIQIYEVYLLSHFQWKLFGMNYLKKNSFAISKILTIDRKIKIANLILSKKIMYSKIDFDIRFLFFLILYWNSFKHLKF